MWVNPVSNCFFSTHTKRFLMDSHEIQCCQGFILVSIIYHHQHFNTLSQHNPTILFCALKTMHDFSNMFASSALQEGLWPLCGHSRMARERAKTKSRRVCENWAKKMQACQGVIRCQEVVTKEKKTVALKKDSSRKVIHQITHYQRNVCGVSVCFVQTRTCSVDL